MNAGKIQTFLSAQTIRGVRGRLAMMTRVRGRTVIAPPVFHLAPTILMAINASAGMGRWFLTQTNVLTVTMEPDQTRKLENVGTNAGPALPAMAKVLGCLG
ncbi:MAG: hypothetical protein D6706_14970 [Chloroflexi bacterium]|nr:MAG: hypothetical protein D6706_14970 [Chloroflexota bacterium]